MEEHEDFSLCGKAAVTEANLRDEYYWKLVADFVGAQSGEGLELETGLCKNRVLIQVGLLREDNNFPWIVIVNWLKKIIPRHQSADFHRLIERGIATTLSLGSNARLTFLESNVNFNFVGPICDSIGVERKHLLEMRDFSERAQLFEVTNGLILELSNFVAREKLAPIVIVSWLKNFEPEFVKKGNIQGAYALLKGRIKKLRHHCRSYGTRSHRRNAAIENLLQSPFELVRKKTPKLLVKKRMRRDHSMGKLEIKVESEDEEIMQEDGSAFQKLTLKEDFSESGGSDEDDDATESEEEPSDNLVSLLDITMLNIPHLSDPHEGKTPECKKLTHDLLKNLCTVAYKEQPAVAQFYKTLASVSEEITLASPVVFINSNAHFLVDLYDTVEQQIINFEKEIILSTGDKLGRDKLPKFRNFINMSESATSRYIHMACDILSPRSPDTHNYRRHWTAFCEEKSNPSRLSMNQSNQFINYFEAAAGLIHHHKEIALFFSDLLSLEDDKCPNVVLESLAADANDSVIQSLVCALAIVHCKIVGPYWQLLKSRGKYSQFNQYILWLYQKFLNWSKDPATVLEPEETTDVFQQFPQQEKTFDGVFYYCGQWHTNRDMIRACLKRLVKAIAAVTEEHLKAFLPGGSFAEVPSPELSLKLGGCTFFVLTAEYSSSQYSPRKRQKTDKSSKHSRSKNLPSGSSQEDNDGSNLSDYSDNEASNWQARKKSEKTIKKEERVEENMDRDYIMATVTSNGGPCKTQSDLEKMLLRFDGKSRAEKREAIRCEVLYQKMILDNPDPNLDCFTENSTNMAMKLKMVLPRVKPGYSLVLAPKRTKAKPVLQDMAETAMDQSESGHM
ncbi:uncharacterized protein LOC117827528 [Notolabrus celidotus]|uniref:uncharacterized protein LOC117827528 n=1 Tax=Notolabrus celidotus TaxID=1203425 RepID=UPI0014903BFF|nr:uncharacterized protein LOC117827528 [Notolabrus celidotus]XP_034559993.1 uncharacterized protein LOC117827528 [Notolabrus celidotus]XP_034559994.1 uncharacterized protein LOC117827528 [Notolabrus celidotus]XP_034559995.1 uncharacterized protein LOC117827528 [Notolabrus celidotus]XP_034559996.1 uncharacterized protein LOC117827528 [Notolabrus celidotus]